MGHILDAAESAAVSGAKVVARDAKRNEGTAVRAGAVVLVFAILCATVYLLVQGARAPHAITQEEFSAALAERDAKLTPATDKAISALSLSLSGLSTSFAKMEATVAAHATERAVAEGDFRKSLLDSESRLRVEIQGTNGRIDRVLEAVSPRTPR